MDEVNENILRACIIDVPDFPKKGILFRDLTPMLDSKVGLVVLKEGFKEWGRIDVVAGIESRGFIFGMLAALSLNATFIPIRKRGKLPREVYTQKYTLEYGEDAIEVHRDVLRKDRRVLIVDDVLATGGTAEAAWKLLNSRVSVVGMAFVVELEKLGGRNRLYSCGVPITSMVKY